MRQRFTLFVPCLLLVLFSCNIVGNDENKANPKALEDLYGRLKIIEAPNPSKLEMTEEEVKFLPKQLQKLPENSRTFFFALGKYEVSSNGKVLNRSIVVQVHNRRGNSVRNFAFQDRYYLLQLKKDFTLLSCVEIGEYTTVTDGKLVSSSWLDNDEICVKWSVNELTSTGISRANGGKYCYPNDYDGEMDALDFQKNLHDKLSLEYNQVP